MHFDDFILFVSKLLEKLVIRPTITLFEGIFRNLSSRKLLFFYVFRHKSILSVQFLKEVIFTVSDSSIILHN